MNASLFHLGTLLSCGSFNPPGVWFSSIFFSKAESCQSFLSNFPELQATTTKKKKTWIHFHISEIKQNNKREKTKTILPMARIRSFGFLSVGRLPLSLASKSRTLLLSDSLPSDAPPPRAPGLPVRSCRYRKKKLKIRKIDQTNTRSGNVKCWEHIQCKQTQPQTQNKDK